MAHMPMCRRQPSFAAQMQSAVHRRLLGGPWDLVTTYNWAYNSTYNPPKWPYRGYLNYK